MLGKRSSILIREYVLDRCLSDTSKDYTITDLLNACNGALPKENWLSSTNSIRNDLREITARYCIVIDEIRDGHQIYYGYRDRSYSIYKHDFSLESLFKINEAFNILSHFQGLPIGQWLDEMNALIKSKIMIAAEKTSPVIGFEYSKSYVQHMRFFQDLFDAICSSRVLEIVYQSYRKKESKIHVVHPYYLQQKYNRWYLLGLNARYGEISTFALDRIKDVTICDDVYIENRDIDFLRYFDHVVGVAYNKDVLPEKILIWCSSEQYHYLLSNPIHSSQRLVRYEEGKGATFEYTLCINYELEQKFLYYGEKIIVLYPSSLRDRIKHRVADMYRNYDQPDPALP